MPKYKVGNSTNKIEIQDGWLILDVGSGHNPHPQADVLVDREPGASADRSGKLIKEIRNKPLIIADTEALPLSSKFTWVSALGI